jgi:hypothetical protein
MSDEMAGEPTSLESAAVVGDPGPPPIRLRCLAGAALPEELRRDAERLDKLSPAALASMGELLQACALLPLTRDLGEALSRFCLKHELAEADLGRIVNVCRWLLHEASAVDLSCQELAEDVAAIWPRPGALGDVLRKGYPAIKLGLREQLLGEALVRHGNVLVDVDWRLDTITGERHAPKLGVPIALVTLTYTGAEQARRLTLQVTPDKLERLAQIFAALAKKSRLGTTATASAAPVVGEGSR